MENAIRQPPEFQTVRDKTVRQRWDAYICKTELYLKVVKITEAADKQACLLYCGGQGLTELFDTLKAKLVLLDDQQPAQPIDIYTATKKVLSDYFTSTESVTYERSKFRSLKQQEGESCTDYITRLRKKVTFCKFEQYDPESALVDQFIEHCCSNTLRIKLLATPALTLDKLLELAQASELASQYAKDIVSHGENRAPSVDQEEPEIENTWNMRRQRPSQARKQHCYGCGSNSHIHGDTQCPALNRTCFTCNKQGHFSSVCMRDKREPRSFSPRKQTSVPQPRYNRRGSSSSNESANHMERDSRYQRYSNESVNHMERDSDNRRDEEFKTLQINDHDSNTEHYVFMAEKTNDRHKRRWIEVDETQVSFVVDSGATTSIIDADTFTTLFKNRVKLHPSQVRIYSYGSSSPLPIEGVFYPVLHYNNHKIVVPLVVTSIPKAGCLLSEDASTRLGIIKMDNFVNLISDSKVKQIVDGFDKITTGVGKLNNVQMELDIDPAIKPVIQGLRAVPYHQEKLVDKEIERLLKEDIIEPIKSPTTWCSPLHVVHKDNGEIRLCVDLRKANTAIKRRRYPIPTLEDILNQVKDAKMFSKIDLNKGYHQVELCEDSRDITTFRYQNGIYRYKRLVFGLSSAFELFQNCIGNLFRGQRGIVNISDDILVYGANEEEHNQNLKNCLSILQGNGLTINKRKCQFGVAELVYYGFKISEKGMQPTLSKVQAIQSFSKPQCSKDVRSFLGLVNYLGRFINHLSSITQPLRKLTVKDVPWIWGETEDNCFNKLKSIVSSDSVVSHFKTGLPIKVVTDASPVGLGAILLQDQGNANYKPVCYISRSLSNVEQRYSQTEREALAVVWACEKLHLYLYGKKFRIETDHKPLIGLFNVNGNRSARIDRWSLRLLQYDFDLSYIPGNDNPADILSRSPDESQKVRGSSGYELEAEQFINTVISHAIPKSLSLSAIMQASEEDIEIQALIKCLQGEKWEKYPQLLKGYKAVAAELSHKGGIVLRGPCIVIPKSLRTTVLGIVHRTHQGIGKTKSLLRSKVWWPGITQETEQMIKECSSCAAVQPYQKPEPLTMTEMPKPWEKLNIDICGPMPDGWSILGIIDAGTRWPEVFVVRSTVTGVIIRKLIELFSNKGKPVTIVTDNGPQFISHEFKRFCEQWDIQHHGVTPYYPQANSEIERFFRSVMKAVKIAVIENKDWKKELQNFLMVYRNTPHCTTGKSPAELLYGRPLRDDLPGGVTKPLPDIYKHAMKTDSINKQKIKQNADKRLKPSNIQEGDVVLIAQRKKNKFSPNFASERFTVLRRNKATLKLQGSTGRTLKRHVSAVKLLNNPKEKRIFNKGRCSLVEELDIPALIDISPTNLTGEPAHQAQIRQHEEAPVAVEPIEVENEPQIEQQQQQQIQHEGDENIQERGRANSLPQPEPTPPSSRTYAQVWGDFSGVITESGRRSRPVIGTRLIDTMRPRGSRR